jgi:hypothetical protein
VIDTGSAAYAFLCLFLGGTLKGVVGLGLPLLSLPLMSFALPLKTAVALLVIPVFVTNLTQSFQGGLFKPTLRRFWPSSLALFVVIAATTQVLVIVPERILYGIVGIALILLTLVLRRQKDWHIGGAQEAWAGPLAGTAGGVLGGISAIYGPPLMIYLAALRLGKREFVAAAALFFLIGNAGLTLGLFGFDVASLEELALSALAALPALAGLWLGRRVHMHLSEQRFATLLNVVYLATGASFVVRALG